MNPSNPFGRPQGGAFQAPNNPMKTGLFQSIGQQSANSQPQTMEVFQSSAFGQPSGLTPPSSHGNTMFGQNPGFLQQPPVFGQPSMGKAAAFGSSTAPAFGQTVGQNQSTVFGQSAAFEQAPVFGQKTAEFGGFGQSQLPPTSTPAVRPPQSHGFGQPMFGQPSTTAVTSMFGGNTVTQSKSFATSTFSFKPASEALFKPIFSASPEPNNPQTTSTSSSPFGSGVTQMSSSCPTSSGFGMPGFRFSIPVAAPSSSTANNPLPAGNNGGSTNPVQFTFSQPAPPSSSSTTNTTATQPTTPSSFSFSLKAPQAQTLSLTEGSGLVQRPAFGDKGQADANTDEKRSHFEALEETNVFARLGKGVKRKEEPFVFSSSQEKPVSEDVPVEAESSRHPPKRPLMRSHHPPGGIFGRAVSGLRKDSTHLGKREVAKETQHQAPKWEEAKGEDAQSQDDNTTAPLATAFVTKETLDKDTESVNEVDPELGAVTPVKHERRESSESLSNASFTDCTVLQCRKIPQSLNKKNIIEKHFSRYGRVSKVICRPAKNLAFVHFNDHASAAKAKKKGKILHQHEIFLLWQRKKQSPEEKTSRFAAAAAAEEEPAGDGPEDTESGAASLRRSLFRAPGGSSTTAVSHSSPVKRMASAKSLQYTTEPQRETGTDPQTSERPVPSSLAHLIGQVAETAEDKYRLLEQRDKVLRQGRPKRTDLNLSKVFVGTCPDMCPEKERYMRETRNQLSVFEVVPDTEMVDHTAAIKEYSRSSADQEEPLPHDLRPLSVLSMTMDYLVTQIMNQDHENQRDWYDFVWNRTRGIRKDITQQRLCCPHTVSLIEKCTRFHVHCAHHLCEEQLSSFDAKINNENMTKCLQSLKEMYQDLATHQIYCPKEAEFRQYSVLLRLNDGDILREVQQFRDEVRNSAEVKFAVQAFASVNSNNFVRFFKLVKGASYLASCLLHRYFNQVRTKALKCLNIAHTVGTRSTAFPLEDITRMFMFRSSAEATEFIHQYGLNVSDGIVELNRTNYQEPELLSQKKSDVILSKKTVLTGEVVNGGPLPNPPQHVPVCSFDSKNKYCGEVPHVEPTTTVTAKVEVNMPTRVEPLSKGGASLGSMEEPSPPPAEDLHRPSFTPDSQPAFQLMHQPVKLPSPPPPAPPPPVYSDEEIKSELDSVIEEVVRTALMEIADVGVTYVKTALEESSVQVESLVTEVLGQMLQEVSSEEFKAEERIALEKYRLEQARIQQEHKTLLSELSVSLCAEILNEVTDDFVNQTSTAEIQHAVNEKAERVAKCTEQVCSRLVEDTLNADITLIVEETLDAELQRIQKYIKRWRDVVAVRRHLKRQMRGFPAAPCGVDPRFKLKAFSPSAQPSVAELSRGVVNLGNAGTLGLSTIRSLNMKEEVMQQLRVHYFNQLLLDEMVWTPLHLPTLVTRSIADPPDRIFWKLTLLLPSNQENTTSPADKILSEWLEVKLGGEGSEVRKEQSDGMLKTLFATNTQHERGPHTHGVHISVKSCRGPLSEGGLSDAEKNSELNGTGALMMLLPVMSIVDREDDVFLLSALLQLRQLQQASTWHCPLPLVILVPGSVDGAEDQRKLEEALMLQALVQEDLILEYKFFFIPETTGDMQGSKQLICALDWLLARAPPTLPLSCQSLVDLVEATVSQEFTARVHNHCREFAPSGLHFQDPTAIILLYNAVLAHVADAVSSEDLLKLSWPPGELCLPENRQVIPPLGFNSPQHLAWLREAVLSLQLPQLGQLSAADTWSELCLSVYSFAAQIPVSSHSQPLLMSRLENLLENARLKQQFTKTHRSGRSWIGAEEEMECPSDSLVPWEDVLIICIDHKLKDWQIPRPAVCREDGEILVYFSAESLKGFQPPEEWRLAVLQKHREREQKQEEEKRRTGPAARYGHTNTSLSLRQNLFHSFTEPPEPRNAPVDITHTLAPPELLAHKLMRSVEAEKAESRRSMEQLQRWVDGDALDPLSTPLFVPSSILLSMPKTIVQPRTRKSREISITQESDDLLEQSVCPKNTPKTLSLKWQMKELERQILASQEEELACGLELSSLFNIVND